MARQLQIPVSYNPVHYEPDIVKAREVRMSQGLDGKVKEESKEMYMPEFMREYNRL